MALDWFKNLFKREKTEGKEKVTETPRMVKLRKKPRRVKSVKRPKIKRHVKRKRKPVKTKKASAPAVKEKIIPFSASGSAKKEDVSTKIDEMLEMLKLGPTDFSTLSRSLNIPENLVKEWAKILEEREMVEISYPAMGGPILKLKHAST